MDIMIWILMCLLACFGAVETIGRILYGCRTPRGVSRGYIVVPIGSAETARKQLEYYLSFAQWNGLGRPLVFVSDSEDVRQHFEQVLGGVTGTYFCTIEQLPSFVSE